MTTNSLQSWLDRLTQPLLQVQAIVWQGNKAQEAAHSAPQNTVAGSLLHCPATRSSRTALGVQGRACPVRSAAMPAAVSLSNSLSAATIRAAAPSRSATPLHVVQIRDDALSGQSGQRQNAGRMVISGRMADVCAQLERMAA